MLLARAAQRAAPLARARALSSSPAFTLPRVYRQQRLWFRPRAQFCTLNLRHDAVFGAQSDPAAFLRGEVGCAAPRA